ncbi:class I SAM-dependent methyltransferase [Marivirga sp.]|uniref:class I SAM-dependent methyltransferase n=1 Tax=Marivirga sp. TaxID=2018662 RepID=UPI0025FBAD09|nr:class I SAM-dependent methyltransferase [Marivirga sp.]
MANFNRIASSYDFLKKIIFGEQIEKATNHFLNQMPSNSKILIVGGGTGKILGNFDSSQVIKYLELSKAMINRANEVKSNATIEFIQSDILEWTSNEKYDFVITPFFLDCFNEDQLNSIFLKLKNVLNKKGKWIQTDFYPKNKAQVLMIKIMYAFFILSTNLKTKELANFDLFFEKHQFLLLRKALFYHSMVESKIYQNIG